MDPSKVNVFWFRRDLRLSDNCGLFHALKDQNPVLPVFIFDTNILNNLPNKRDARVTFILKAISDLSTEIGKFDSSIAILHGKPIDVFRNLTKEYQIEKVFANRDYEPYAKERDREIKDFLNRQNIEFITFKDQVIFEKLEIAKEDGAAYRVYTPYKDRWIEKYRSEPPVNYNTKNLTSNFLKITGETPHLNEMGFEASDMSIPKLKIDRETIENYDENRNYPARDGTSRLGIHLRFGTLSIRKAVDAAFNLNKTWLQELIWREFYMMILDNFPKVVDEEFNPKYKNFRWKYDEENFEKWRHGQTGYPMVDAGMRELNQTGYMHNRVRMITASFLTKHLLIDWRWGEAYFAEKLLDYELASNNGGWQWAAGCGTDAQPYFRIFNPTEQRKKYDPEETYTKKWIPEINTQDYPNPIIDHKFARERAINIFKKALQ